MLRKLGTNYQIAIPKEIVKALNLQKNEYFDVKIVDGGVYLTPQVFMPKNAVEKAADLPPEA